MRRSRFEPRTSYFLTFNMCELQLIKTKYKKWRYSLCVNGYIVKINFKSHIIGLTLRHSLCVKREVYSITPFGLKHKKN